MSRLSDATLALGLYEPPAPKTGKILRHRKKSPLHPEEIDRLFLERSKARKPLQWAEKAWKIICYRVETGERAFFHVRGTIVKARETRDTHLATGRFEKAWIMEDT